MRRLSLLVLLFALLEVSSVSATDWRWTQPHLRKQTVTYSCDTLKCLRQTYLKEKHRFEKRVARYDKRRLQEWKHWTHLYIPPCTWYGESGLGPEYSPLRYVMPNAGGSGAFGKYQFMASTYHNVAKYHDWSALDQEIASRREYWQHGTQPWTNC